MGDERLGKAAISKRLSIPKYGDYFGYAFPFEGNGNSDAVAVFGLNGALDTLSRLKGIETHTSSNTQVLYLKLWIRFPV